MDSKIVKALSVLVVLLLVFALAVGCARRPATEEPVVEAPVVEEEQIEEDPVAEEDEYPEPGNPELPLVSEEQTLTIWSPMRADLAAQIESLADSEYFKELRNRTGINAEFVHPTAGREQEALNVLLAAGDLPDIIQFTIGSSMYPGGMDRAIADGVVFNINDYARRYAPNFYSWKNSREDIRQAIMTDEGNISGFYQIIPDGPQPAWFGGVVRRDWLDALGMDTPVTYEDWHRMLVGFRDEMAAEAPMMLNWTGVQNFNWFNAGFGVSGGFMQIDNIVKFGPIMEGYKEYLEMMAQWYSEGLIDKDFATRRDFVSPDSYTTTGMTGTWSDVYVLLALRQIQSGNPDFMVTALPSPVRYVGQQLHLRQTNTMVGTVLKAITTNANDPILAMRWLDYNYSPEGSLLANFGIEGETFEFDAEGNPRYTSYVYENPDGLGLALAIGIYSRPPSGGTLYNWTRELVPMPENNLQAPDIWGSNNDGAHNLPTHITLTSDEAAEFSTIMADINTFVQEMSVKYIMGHQTFDNFETDFIDVINNMDIERAIYLNQAALDRFNAR